jgi:hypothetical protein
MRTWWSLYQDQEAALGFEWADPVTGLLYDFTAGHTFAFQLVSNHQWYLNKTNFIVPAATSPNVVVNIAAGELDTPTAVPAGLYLAILKARRTADSVDFIFMPNDPPVVEILTKPVAVS